MFRRFISVLAVGYIVYHIIYVLDVLLVLGFGGLSITRHIGIHIGGILFFVFLLVPAKKGMPRKRPPWYDCLLAFIALVPTIHYAIWGEDRMLFNLGLTLPRDTLMAWLTIVLSLEAARRAVSASLAALVGVFVLYPMIAGYLPGIFHSSTTSFMREGEFLYLAQDGMFGIPAWISSTVLIVFIFFGHVLFSLGMGKSLMDLATSLLGHVRGGPAKVAVVASGFFGMISGTSVANVATTGSFTIPMMKKLGYRPVIAAAIESSASIGGQYMPPVMGAAIFVLCAWIGMPYREVVVIAAIPAVLYFLALLIVVDLEAAKEGLRGMPKEELPSFMNTVKEGWWYFLPIIIFFYTLLKLSLSAQKAGLYSILCALAISLLRKKTRPSAKEMVTVCEKTVETMMMIGTACICAGIMVGCVALTGLAVRLSEGIVVMSGGNLILLLVFGAAASMILGMGLPSIPCYVFLALMLAPALEKVGVPTIAAHLFVFYYGVVSFITPPVCMASFAAAGIASSPPMKTGFYSMRVGIGAYLLPFAFCTMPGILLIGTSVEIVSSIFFMFISIIAVVIGFEGYLFNLISWLERAVLIIFGILVIAPQGSIRLLALLIILITVGRLVLLRLRNRHRIIRAESLQEGSIAAD